MISQFCRGAWGGRWPGAVCGTRGLGSRGSEGASPHSFSTNPLPQTAGSEEDKWASGQGPGDPVGSSTLSLGQELMEFVAAEPCRGGGNSVKAAGEMRSFLLYVSLARPTVFAQREGFTCMVTLNLPSHWINHPFPPKLPTEQNIHIFFAQRQFVN